MGDNERAINGVKLSLKKDYDKEIKKGINTRKLKTYLNSKDINSKGILIGTSVPTVVTIAIGSLGVITLSVATLISLAGNNIDPNFSNNVKEVSKVIETSKEFIRNMSIHSIANLCIPASYLIYLKAKLKKKNYRHSNCKFYTKDEFEKIAEIEKELDLIDQIENDGKTFAAYFLENLDISKNSLEYNKELIRRLTQETEIINGKGRRKENQENLTVFLENSINDVGVSPEYLDSLGIKKLKKE